MDDEDKELVREAKAGSRPAFVRLVDRYRGRVFALAVAVTGDEARATRLTRDTVLAAHRLFPTLEHPERFPGWLTRLAYQLGREAAGGALPLSESTLDQSDAAAPATPPPNAVQPDSQKRVVDALLEALPERVRVALDLRFREGLSYAEIAETLEMPSGEVGPLLAKGARRLRAKLRPYLKKRLAKGAS
jgi:RNA polymerase sigma-70 factor (ECF subfamily)